MRIKSIASLALLFVVLMFLVQCQSYRPGIDKGDESSVGTITYHNAIKAIATNYCTSCHSGNNPAAGLNLGSYESFKNSAFHGALLHRINDRKNPMPQAGLMPKEYRWIISQWAKAGFPLGIDSSLIAGNEDATIRDSFLNSSIEVVDVRTTGLAMLDSMQGHWIGKMNIMGQKYPWFAFDYRAISASHVHGIFEGGSMGNLFTSFFVTNFNGKTTIMARNGGLLNGIYRTSYFVMDSASMKKDKQYYRFVDAYGGSKIMWMELTFSKNSLEFNSYTSRLGLNKKASIHMRYKATRKSISHASEAAKRHGFPAMEIEKDFAKGLPLPEWGPKYGYVSSATYLAEGQNERLEDLALTSRDPFPIQAFSGIGTLKVSMYRQKGLEDVKLMVYLSHKPLTHPNGRLILKSGSVDMSRFNTVFSFPEIVAPEEDFTFTYLHPGYYYVTVVADLDKNGYPSKGDLSASGVRVVVESGKAHKINIVGLVKN